MAKKRIVGLLLSFVMALGITLFSHEIKREGYLVNADGGELVGTPEVGWNNVDYSANDGRNWVPNKDDKGVPQEGYCILPLYPANIASNTYVDENLLTANITGCNVGDHILINGVECQNVSDVIIYCYPQNGFFLYVPHNSVAFSDEYEYVTIEVLEGMSIDGTAQVVATRFEYRGTLGSYDQWQVNPAPIEKKQAEFNSISWNNMDFSYTLNQEWCGDLESNGAPSNGYCILAFFNEVGKTYQETVIGDLTMTGRGVIGKGFNIDNKVKVNGVNLVDIIDAKCYLFPQYGLFFYIPETSLTYDETYKSPVIAMEKGVHFNNVYLPEITFKFCGELGQKNSWIYIKAAEEYNHFEYYGVAGGWNNTLADASHNHSVLQFGEYGVDYLKNDGVASSTNLVNRYSECGNKITINGIPLWEFGEVIVSYIHGYCYFYINLPVSVLVPSNGYKIVTLHIEEGTIFYDTMLCEVTLYLFDGKWVNVRPETPDDNDYTGALTFETLFGQEEAVLDDNNNQLLATKESTIDSLRLFVDYKLINTDSAFVLYALGNKNQNGIRIVIKDNIISLFDATEGSVLLGNAELSLFNYDEWYSLLLYTKVVDNHLSIFVAVDDIIYIHVDNVNLVNKDNLGDKFSLILGNGKVSFKNATLGADNKKPILTYNGKTVYGVLAGSDIIDFTNRVSAFDAIDGDVTDLITFNWPTGAITNSKINKGVWEVIIIASDKSNNKTQAMVTVVAADKLEVTVTFDGQNSANYQIGDHIACIPDPIKEGDGNTTYRFIGWYYNDRLWDFENDYIFEDMNLVSKFQEAKEEYRVTFNVEGLKDISSYTLYFAYGTTLNLDTFQREGYTLKAYLNDEEIESITITEDVAIKLVYTSDGSHNKKKGCGGDMTAMTIIIPILAGAALIFLIVIKKKGGKKHE